MRATTVLIALGLLLGTPVCAGEDESRWMRDGEYIYALPYACTDQQNHVVVQGNGGQYTHQGRSFYSLDFLLRVGTPVHAARGGVVQQVKETFKVGGLDSSYKNRANLVRIVHSDSTAAEYLHLVHQGVVVSEGEAVVRGQRIAYSGMTGYTSGPHLHFDVTTKVGKRAPTMAVRFLTSTGVENLQVGINYQHPDCQPLQ